MSALVRVQRHLDPLLFSSANQRRTPGLHLTDIIRDIQLSAGVDRNKNNFSELQLKAFQLQGYLWEDVYTEKLRDRLAGGAFGDYVRMGEVAFNGERAFFVAYSEQDGKLLTPIPPGYVLMSPDGLRLDGEVMPLLEMKWTTKSSNMNPEKEKPEWFHQARCYCLALSAALGVRITAVELDVFFAAGNYMGSGPVFEEMSKEFHNEEIVASWEMCVGHVKLKVAEQPEHPWAKYWLGEGKAA